MQGCVSFVPLGPGDPELITIKALNELKRADVIVVPSTQGAKAENGGNGTEEKPMSRAAAVIDHWDLHEKVRTFHLPMSSNSLPAQRAYDDICTEIAQMHSRKLSVAVAVEGDVSIYASIHYVMERLAAMGIPVSQQPGITSFIAAAALGRLSLVSRQEQLHVLPGIVREEEMVRLLADCGTLVMMKLSKCEEGIKAFMANHRNYAYHYFENIGAADGFHTNDVGIIAERRFPYFSLMIIWGR